MYTYSQEKIGFNYFYCKRVVENVCVSTRPLDMVLLLQANTKFTCGQMYIPYIHSQIPLELYRTNSKED